MKKIVFLCSAIILMIFPIRSQSVKWSPEDIKLLTKSWVGELEQHV